MSSRRRCGGVDCWKDTSGRSENVLEKGLFLVCGSPEGVISMKRRVVRQRYKEKRPKPRVSPWSDHSPLPRTTYRRS
jgi:hypothetical protein